MPSSAPFNAHRGRLIYQGLRGSEQGHVAHWRSARRLSMPHGEGLGPCGGCSGRQPALPVLTDAPLGDRPWERASPGPEGTVARPGPHGIALIAAAIGTINNPLAILLTAGSWGRKSSSRPALGGPADQQQWQCQPAANPGQSPCAFPSPAQLASSRKGAWRWRWEPRFQPPAHPQLRPRL